METPTIQRQKNVQQQNRTTEVGIRSVAMHWRNSGLPELLSRFGTERGVDWSRSIVLRLEIDFPGMHNLIWGSLLTDAERFLDFELETRLAHTELVAVHKWEDVTSAHNLSLRNRGIGAGSGALAVKVLRELNE